VVGAGQLRAVICDVRGIQFNEEPEKAQPPSRRGAIRRSRPVP
jgi:hypothetical protein